MTSRKSLRPKPASVGSNRSMNALRACQSGLLRACSFYAILDTGYVAEADWLRKYDALVSGGAGVVQIRAKSETPRERETLLASVLEYRQGSERPQPPLILNDDIQLCLRYDGVGLHIGQDDTPPIEARDRLGPDRLLGLSTHSVAQIDAATNLPDGTLDYFAVGPVFATKTKPDYTPVGLELVRWAAAQKPRLPFFCIGGIDRDNVAALRKAGGARPVAVSDPLLAKDTAEAVREYVHDGDTSA